MGAFLFAAIALVTITMLLLLRPWRHHDVEHEATTREINAGIYRDQLAELARDLAAGTLADADHAQARDELQRRLLDDTALADTASTHTQRARRSTLLIAIALPLAASGLYALLGVPTALLPHQPQTAGGAAHQVTSADIEQMVASLAARLEKNPGDTKGWAMLARSYKAMGRMAEAQAAFARIGTELHTDAVLLAAYADVLATLANGDIEGRPLQLVTAALQLDPDNAMALSLAATAAYKRKDFSEATRHWERLLKQLPPDSDDAKWLVQTLAEIRGPQAAARPDSAPKDARATAVTVDAADKSITGQVSLAPELQGRVHAGDTVFVFARTTDGVRAPLAVQRARVADLPLRFRLDDTMAMSPQHRLSEAKQVRIEARVSRRGDATPAAGDLIGTSEPVAPGAERVALTIDRVRP